MTIKWRNLAVFAVAFAVAGAFAVWRGIPILEAEQLVVFGIAPCAFIVRMGWLE